MKLFNYIVYLIGIHMYYVLYFEWFDLLTYVLTYFIAFELDLSPHSSVKPSTIMKCVNGIETFIICLAGWLLSWVGTQRVIYVYIVCCTPFTFKPSTKKTVNSDNFISLHGIIILIADWWHTKDYCIHI